jgi:HK97 family phage major capsid protein
MKKMSKLSDKIEERGISLEAFGDQKETILGLVNAIDEESESRATELFEQKMADAGIDENAREYLRMQKGLPRRKLRKIDKQFQNMLSVWKNNGTSPTDSQVRFNWNDLVKADNKRVKAYTDGDIKDADFVDTQFSSDQPLLIPRVISQVVREAIEPRIVLQDLLTRINFSNGTQVTFPALSAFKAQDIAEGGEYPEGRIELAGEVTATIGKSGVAVKMTEEMVRYSMFDVMSMHLRAAGRSLIRWKEEKTANLISSQGTVTFNNSGAGTPRTTGRDSAGALNGTFHIDDLFVMYASLANAGFVPNTLIMHPFGWLIFARDPNLRHFGFMNGGPMFQTYQGQVGAAEEWRLGGLNQNTTVDDPFAVASTHTNVPRPFFPVPLNIVVSPFVPYDATLNTTEIWMCDRAELGVIVVDEDVTTDQWNDPARDIRHVKLRERYALALLNQGQAMRQAKGVLVGKSYPIEDNLSWEAGTGALPTGEGAFPIT